MPGPLDAMRTVHNAIRRDVDGIEEQAWSSLEGIGDRLATLRRMMKLHEDAEEAVLFPAIDALAPHVGAGYRLDHEAVEALLEAQAAAIASGDPQAAARASTATRAALFVHLDKEERHLLPVCHGAMTPEREGELLGAMAARTPREDFEPFVSWLLPLLDAEDRAGIMSAWQSQMPPPVFAGLLEVARGALDEAAWREVEAALAS